MENVWAFSADHFVHGMYQEFYRYASLIDLEIQTCWCYGLFIRLLSSNLFICWYYVYELCSVSSLFTKFYFAGVATGGSRATTVKCV